MLEPIPAVIDYRVEQVTHKPTLDSWNTTKGCESALFLCRITRMGNYIVDSKPVAVFNLDSEGFRFADDFLKRR